MPPAWDEPMAALDGSLDLPRPIPPPRPGGRHRARRSLAEITSPAGPRGQQQHDRHRGGRHFHHHHRRRRHRPSCDETAASSAYPASPIRLSIDMSRSEAATPLMSPGQSRRTSVQAPRDDGAWPVEARESRGARLRLEQDKAAVRAEALRRSLADLNAFSAGMTKRLDDTYYAVLEKMSSLQNTVMAIKDLAEASRELCDTFDRDSHELEQDIAGQLAAVGRSDEQQASLVGLQTRIRDGRARVQTLTGRVDVVRERLEKWERADRAWQERTRRRLKIFWSVTSVVTAVVIALAFGEFWERQAEPGAVL